MSSFLTKLRQYRRLRQGIQQIQRLTREAADIRALLRLILAQQERQSAALEQLARAMDRLTTVEQAQVEAAAAAGAPIELEIEDFNPRQAAVEELMAGHYHRQFGYEPEPEELERWMRQHQHLLPEQEVGRG